MKKIILSFAICLFTCTVFSQEESKEKRLSVLPSVDIKTLDGKTFNTKNISNDGKPVIISLWAMWCKPCLNELMAIADVYDDWVEETGVKLYAISIDDTKESSKVAPYVNGKGWEYEVLLDVNSDFKRAMNVPDVPFLCILNGQNEIVWSHTSYALGSENEVYEIIKKIAENNPIK